MVNQQQPSALVLSAAQPFRHLPGVRVSYLLPHRNPSGNECAPAFNNEGANWELRQGPKRRTWNVWVEGKLRFFALSKQDVLLLDPTTGTPVSLWKFPHTPYEKLVHSCGSGMDPRRLSVTDKPVGLPYRLCKEGQEILGESNLPGHRQFFLPGVRFAGVRLHIVGRNCQISPVVKGWSVLGFQVEGADIICLTGDPILETIVLNPRVSEETFKDFWLALRMKLQIGGWHL